jgi:hypothetical protein
MLIFLLYQFNNPGTSKNRKPAPFLKYKGKLGEMIPESHSDVSAN